MSKKKVNRVEVHPDNETLRLLKHQAVDHELDLKPYIEATLRRIANKSYTDLWNEKEALVGKLKQLTENEQTT